MRWLGQLGLFLGVVLGVLGGAYWMSGRSPSSGEGGEPSKLDQLVAQFPKGPQLPPDLVSEGTSQTSGRSPSGRALLYVSPPPDDTQEAAGEVSLQVNGEHLGSVPYMGHLDCTPGEKLEIELIPKSGEVQRFTRKCQSEVRVEPRPF